MIAINKFMKHNPNPFFKKFKSNSGNKNFYDRNKYFFNELYKIKAIPTDELIFLVKRILKHDTKDPTNIDLTIKKIARGFVLDHHELFPGGIEDGVEATDDEYEEDTPKYKNLNNKKETMENDVKNDVENVSENRVENTIEKIEEIKQDVEKIEELQHTPKDKHLKDFNDKIEELKEDIHKKFNDMIDAHIDLKKSIEEKRNISNSDAKSRIENMEGKIEMLYGKQMEESMKHKKPTYTPKIKTKDDILRQYISNKLNYNK